MTNNKIIDESFVNPKEQIKWKHFIPFYLIQIVIITITYWIAKNVNQHTTEMFYANIPALLAPPIISGLMIYTYKGNYQLPFLKKIIALIGLLLINFIWTLIINYFNLFNRNMTQIDIIEGLQRTSIYEVIMLIVCLPIIGFIKSKKQS